MARCHSLGWRQSRKHATSRDTTQATRNKEGTFRGGAHATRMLSSRVDVCVSVLLHVHILNLRVRNSLLYLETKLLFFGSYPDKISTLIESFIHKSKICDCDQPQVSYYLHYISNPSSVAIHEPANKANKKNKSINTMPPQMNNEQGETATMFRLVPPDLNALLDVSMKQFQSHLTDYDESSSSSSCIDETINIVDVKCPQQRSVSFCSEVEIHPIINRSDMSDDELQQTWLTSQDIREGKQLVRSTIFLMKTGAGACLTEEDYFCSRGLENCVDKEYSARVKKSLRIALAMQRVLRRAGKSSPEMIAKAYRSYTLRSRKKAYRKALEDESAAASR